MKPNVTIFSHFSNQFQLKQKYTKTILLLLLVVVVVVLVVVVVVVVVVAVAVAAVVAVVVEVVIAFLRRLCSSNPAEQQNTVARRVKELQKTYPKMAPKSA